MLVCTLFSFVIPCWWRFKPPRSTRSLASRSTRSSPPRSTRSSPPSSTRSSRGGLSPPMRESYLSTCVRKIVTVLPLPQYFKQSGAEEIADMSLKNTSIRDHVQVDYRNGRSSCLRTEKSKYYHLILWLNTT